MDTSVKRNKKASILNDDPLWYKDAIIYQVHIKSFFDANNDGIGDFPGLLAKLDYIAELGVDAIWLLPFYPSPRRDDGYEFRPASGARSWLWVCVSTACRDHCHLSPHIDAASAPTPFP